VRHSGANGDGSIRSALLGVCVANGTLGSSDLLYSSSESKEKMNVMAKHENAQIKIARMARGCCDFVRNTAHWRLYYFPHAI